MSKTYPCSSATILPSDQAIVILREDSATTTTTILYIDATTGSNGGIMKTRTKRTPDSNPDIDPNTNLAVDLSFFYFAVKFEDVPTAAYTYYNGSDFGMDFWREISQNVTF